MPIVQTQNPWSKFKVAHLREQEEAFVALRVKREYDNAFAWNEKNWRRCVNNWQMYWGIDSELGFGQWPADDAAEMIAQRRQIATYNLCGPVVDNIGGGIMKAPFGFDFSPISSKITQLTYKIKNVLYIERELMDWRSNELDMVIGGLVYQSVMEMYISREYDKDFGNIGLRTLLPGSVIFDPKWKTSRSKDCKKAWKIIYLTPLEMLEIYSDQQERIMKSMMFKLYGEDYLRKLAELQENIGDEYGNNTGIIPYMAESDEWGTQMKVIECYHMEKVKKTINYVITADGKKYIPDDITNVDEKAQWLDDNVPDWTVDQVFEETQTEDVQFVSTICPSLSGHILLSHGPTEVQCGRLQFFPWSAKRHNGEVGGIIDAIKDLQMNVNYWESLLTNKIQTEGGGGAQFVEPDMFESHQEYLKYVRNRNNPQAVFRLKRGTLRQYQQGPAVPVQKSSFPAEAMEHLKHLIEVMLPRISKVSPASQGRSESSAESGYLYKLKKLQSDIEQYTIYEGLRNFYNEIGEAYLYQASITHGNKIEREFYDPRTKDSFKINEHRMRVLDNGDIVEEIVDDMSLLRSIRHRVMVVESEESPTRKIELMQTSSELMAKLPKEKVLTLNEMAHVLTMQVDAFDDEKKAQMERFHEEEMQSARWQLRALAAENRLRAFNAFREMGMQMPMDDESEDSDPIKTAGSIYDDEEYTPQSSSPFGTMPVNPGYKTAIPAATMGVPGGAGVPGGTAPATMSPITAAPAV